MDDTDAERADEGPFDEPLIPAVRPVTDKADAFEREFVPAAVLGDDGANPGDERHAAEAVPTTRPARDAADEEDGPFDEALVPAVRPAEPEARVGGGEEADADEPVERDAVQDVEELVAPRQTLEPRIQLVWILQSGISGAVFGVITAIAFEVLPFGEAWWGMVVFTGLFVLGAVLALLRYRIWCYEVREDSLFLRRGVVTRVTTVAPYVRIQHVDVRRGAVERTFGLATTVVYTAGSRGADFSIPGLTPDRADDLQDRLKQLAIAAEGEDAV